MNLGNITLLNIKYIRHSLRDCLRDLVYPWIHAHCYYLKNIIAVIDFFSYISNNFKNLPLQKQRLNFKMLSLHEFYYMLIKFQISFYKCILYLIQKSACNLFIKVINLLHGTIYQKFKCNIDIYWRICIKMYCLIHATD